MAFIMFFIIFGCTFSKEELEENIKDDVERELKKQNRDVEVKSVKLTKNNENEYVGIVKIVEGEFERSYNLKVFVEGQSYSTDFKEIKE